MKKKFEYSFDVEGPDSIKFEYSKNHDEELEIVIQDGKVGMHLNKSGCIALAKLLIKLGTCDFKKGFHFHFNADFDGDKKEVMWVGV